MKALYIPALLLSLLLAISLWNAAYVEQQTAHCLQTLQQAEALAREKSWDKAKEQMHRSYSSWHSGQDYFHAIMEHQELDEAETFFAAAFAACDAQDEPDFQASLAQLQTALQHLSEKQQVNLGNIL